MTTRAPSIAGTSATLTAVASTSRHDPSGWGSRNVSGPVVPPRSTSPLQSRSDPVLVVGVDQLEHDWVGLRGERLTEQLGRGRAGAADRAGGVDHEQEVVDVGHQCTELVLAGIQAVRAG